MTDLQSDRRGRGVVQPMEGRMTAEVVRTRAVVAPA